MTPNNSSFVQINKNLDNNEVYIPVVVSRENFIVQLKIVDEANKTLHHIKNNKIDQNKLEKDIKLTQRKDRNKIIDTLKRTSKDFNKYLESVSSKRNRDNSAPKSSKYTQDNKLFIE